MINVFQPTLGEQELAAVAEVFNSSWLGSGPRTRQFEEAFAAHLGVDPENVLYINSCTAGLFLATELLELGMGDEVVLPSISFVAAANAVASCGATPIFCDVDPHTLNPSLEDVAAAVTDRTRAVVLLHYGGYPGDVARIAEYCRKQGISLVEDAACAVDSRVAGRACGTFGDIATWSFDAMKVLVTGDGGMLYARDRSVADRARRLSYHGLQQANGFTKAQVSHRWWELDVREFARRVIGNDLTAAIGLVQLSRLPEFVTKRRQVTEYYRRELVGMPALRLPPPLPAGHRTSYYFFWIQMDAAIRDKVAADLYRNDIYTTFRYPPLHRVPAYGSTSVLPGSDQSAEETLCLPLHQGLDQADIHHVVTQLRKSLEANANH
ncbi:DegT/DnrJ/EryC1/StrS family aminotransferase [Micromonospora sp. LOL_023]|uniref:DegT/DnrJ/EryC1/StrS family aminotransferase n=1 Tax=Micromonospora sp. LOL_023 TaxID=3345418 RepID=UPI003A837DCB